MSYRDFKLIFYGILNQKPLPNGDQWTLQRLENAGLRNNQGWTEILYRSYSSYQCNHRHDWVSAWSIILFQFRLDASDGRGRVRMKRFGQRCNKCKTDDDTYHVGFCRIKQARHMVECLLLYILQRCYEGRSDEYCDDQYCIIPISTVPKGGKGGSPHPKDYCEACAYDRCREKYRELTEKK